LPLMLQVSKYGVPSPVSFFLALISSTFHFIREANRLETETKKEIIRENFLDLLNETKDINKRSHWGSRVRRLLEEDKRYQQCPPELREELFEGYVQGLRKDKDEVKRAAKRKRHELEKQKRKEEEAKKKEAERLRLEREAEEKEKFEKKKKETIKKFQEILKDRIDDPRTVWRDFEWEFKKDDNGRDIISTLGNEAAPLFEKHLKNLKSDLEGQFNKCLKRVLDEGNKDSDDNDDSTPSSNEQPKVPKQLELGLLWVEAKEMLQPDPVFKTCRSKIDCEKLFKRHMQGHIEAAKNELHEFLKEAGSKKNITRFTSTTGEGWQRALDSLAGEPCFERLANCTSEREAVISDYIEDLQDQHLKSKRRKY